MNFLVATDYYPGQFQRLSVESRACVKGGDGASLLVSLLNGIIVGNYNVRHPKERRDKRQILYAIKV